MDSNLLYITNKVNTAFEVLHRKVTSDALTTQTSEVDNPTLKNKNS